MNNLAKVNANLLDTANYPENLAWAVRHFILLVSDQVQPGDIETFRRLMVVVSELERVFQLVE